MLEGTPSPYPIEVVWEGGRRYRGGPADGPTLIVDGSRTDAPSPVDAVLISLAACSAIDVVEILEKRRTPASALSVRCDFSRASNPPRRITHAALTFRVTTDSEQSHVDRAVELSMEKYCSVSNSLDPETEIQWRVELEQTSTAGSG